MCNDTSRVCNERILKWEVVIFTYSNKLRDRTKKELMQSARLNKY